MSGLPGSQLSLYVFDASSLIDLENSRELGLLSELGSLVVVPSRVAKEVNRRGTPIHRWFQGGIGRGRRRRERRRVADFVVPAEGGLFLRLKQQHPYLSDADIQGIVMAHQRNATYVVEENAATRVAEGLGIRCLRAQEFIDEVRPRLF